ncbi:MAG: choline dehydrogenase [Methanobacterium sp. PtaU1.Bin242]|nr:MAG: choline dehydrogenase [Methanobacterium sp. PtaU1.Bin242]
MNVIVVGSGAGGGTVARELSRAGVNVTIIDKGPLIKPKNAGECYESFTSGVEIMNTSCMGGTTMVTLGNAVRTCQHIFKKMGVDLEDEFKEVEMELNVNPLPDSHLGSGTRMIMDASASLGFNALKMPKFIDPSLCKPCGECALGCKRDAKWTSMKYLQEAVASGAKVVDETAITEIITEQGKVTGVKSKNREFKADMVVLSAGAISTPRLLSKTGIKAGDNLFVDTFVTVGGMFKGVKFNKEVLMYALIKQDDIILSPHYSEILVDKLKDKKARKKDILGMMIKIKDDASGKVTPDSVVKHSTARDVELLSCGSAIAGSILTEAGVDPRTLVSTPPRGAHPGGTAAMGKVVDTNLETDIPGLYVADASVFPEAPGAPPVLTIIALAKRLAKHIIHEYN